MARATCDDLAVAEVPAAGVLTAVNFLCDLMSVAATPRQSSHTYDFRELAARRSGANNGRSPEAVHKGDSRMGYVANYFDVEVEAWMKAGWLGAGSKLIEFGGQEFYCDQSEARGYVEAFLRRRKLSEDQIKTAVGANDKLSVAAVYKAIGVEYSSIDVDDKHGAAFFDLNSFAPSMQWRGAFDFVNNEGTIEHLVNPINGFQVTHELLKVGGIARHSIPLTGHRDHGFIYPTVKFYACMLGENRYELLRSDIHVGQSGLDFVDRRFRTLADDGAALSDGIKLTDAWLFIVYRKTQPAEFRIPSDHLIVDVPEALAERLSGNFSAFGRMRLTANGKRDPIGDDFERQAELQRREHDHNRRLARERGSFISSNLALLAAAFAIGLNGAGLLMATANPNRFAFSVGVMLGFLSTRTSYARLVRWAGPFGHLVERGMQFLWLGSAVAFIAGCIS
jgi:SAM-dependent methyltransferase